jgi:transcriptional regulator with XRE-family HTH domain
MSQRDLPEARARFAKRLKAIRVPRGFRTARSLAEALGIDENRYTRYERGEVEPNLDLLLQICSLLGATPNDLLCDYIGSSGDGCQPGFAESYPPSYAPSPDDGRRERMQPRANPLLGTIEPHRIDSNIVGAQQDAIAWLLSGELAALHGKAHQPGPGGPFEQLKRTSEIFADLKSDPFAFVARVMRDSSLLEADLATQQRIEKLISDLARSLHPKP